MNQFLVWGGGRSAEAKGNLRNSYSRRDTTVWFVFCFFWLWIPDVLFSASIYILSYIKEFNTLYFQRDVLHDNVSLGNVSLELFVDIVFRVASSLSRHSQQQECVQSLRSSGWGFNRDRYTTTKRKDSNKHWEYFRRIYIYIFKINKSFYHPPAESDMLWPTIIWRLSWPKSYCSDLSYGPLTELSPVPHLNGWEWV